MTKWLLTGFLILTSCTAPYWDHFRLDGKEIIFTDRASEICGNNARACYIIKAGIIVAEKGDWCAVGHEIGHITYGDYEHETVLEQPLKDHTRR